MADTILPAVQALYVKSVDLRHSSESRHTRSVLSVVLLVRVGPPIISYELTPLVTGTQVKKVLIS